MTEAGLNTVNLSQMNTFQQFILFLLILLGSAIWVSIAVLHVRRKAFERRFKSIVEEERQRRRNRSTSKRRLSLSESRSRSKPEVDGVAFRGRKSIPKPEVDGVVVRGRKITPETDGAEETDGHLTSPNNKSHSDSNPSLTALRSIKPESEAEDLGISDLNLDPQAGQPLGNDTGVTRRITFASPASPTRERQHGRLFSMVRILQNDILLFETKA